MSSDGFIPLGEFFMFLGILRCVVRTADPTQRCSSPVDALRDRRFSRQAATRGQAPWKRR